MKYYCFMFFYFLLLLSCSNKHAYKSINEVKDSLITNYKNNSQYFSDLGHLCSKFKNIRAIDFSSDFKYLTIKYQKDEEGSIWGEAQNESIGSLKVINILRLEKDVNLDSLNKLKKILNVINCHGLMIYDGYNENSGTYNRQVELAYKKWNDINFYYKIFEHNLDSNEIHHFTKFLAERNKGDIIDKNVIWYYK